MRQQKLPILCEKKDESYTKSAELTPDNSVSEDDGFVTATLIDYDDNSQWQCYTP